MCIRKLKAGEYDKSILQLQNGFYMVYSIHIYIDQRTFLTT
jgi:hypothetical protein